MDVQIKRMLAHPKRTEILGYLIQKSGVGEQGASQAELSDALGLTKAKVKYHLTVLCDADLIAHTDKSKSGASECYVAAVPAGK